MMDWKSLFVSKPSGTTVVRVAAKDQATREKEGGSFHSSQRKLQCQSLQVNKDGVIGTRGFFSSLFAPASIMDYNYYRSQGDPERFKANSRDRAVSVAVVSAYDLLSSHLSGVQHGDLGENILIQGPIATADPKKGLHVGMKIHIGSQVVLTLTEANNPCYRFNTQTWAAQAKELWGNTAPDDAQKWFKSPKCPLNHEVFPGVRGWLARVDKEGEVKPGDKVRLVAKRHTNKTKKDEKTRKDLEKRPVKRRASSAKAKKSGKTAEKHAAKKRRGVSKRN